MATSDRYLVLH